MDKLSNRLYALAEKGLKPILSMPGEPAYSIEMEQKFNANAALRDVLVNNLPTIIRALQEKDM